MRDSVSMYASSTVMGFSGTPVMWDGPTGWSYSELPDIRRVSRPGNREGRWLMKSHVAILFRDRSREWRLRGNWRVVSEVLSVS